MIQYIYFVKCPHCEDEPFDFFDEAKAYAASCITKKPIITQVEVDRNDFGECVGSSDLGTIWSWEEMMATDDEPAKSIFTKDDLKCSECDAEFDALDNSLDVIPDNFRKPVPNNMSIEDLVEAMEENEDTVECKWCNELFDKSECRYEVDLGWLCHRCIAAIESRGDILTFRDGFLEEGLTEEPTQLDEAFKYLAAEPDAKIKILDELRADSLLKPCVTEDDALSVNNYIISQWSTSGYQTDGRITDFNIDETGEIYITVSRSADKILVYTLDDLKSRSSRSFLSYKLLKRIKEIASDLNKAMKPTKAELAATRTAERDANVLDALAKDPDTANELKANIVRIEYRIPLNDFGYSVDDTDIEDIPISEKSADKLNKIHDNFMNLPFANAAIRAGIVEDRLPNTDYDRNISGSWGAIGNITFRVPIDSLSKNAQSLIQFAKYTSKAKGEEDTSKDTKKKKSPKTICCYRLANALIQYFGNDVFFYRELAMAGSASGNESEEKALTESSVEHKIGGNPSYASWIDGDIELFYDDLYVEYGYGGMVDNDWYSPPEPRHWFSGEVSHTFLVSPEDVAEFLFNDCMTEEDAKDIPSGLDALAEDADAYDAFMEQHLDELIEKYKQKILDNWEEQAAKDYEEKQIEADYNNGPDPDEIYERRRDGEW